MNYIYESEGKNRADAEKKALDFLHLDAASVTFKPTTSRKGLLGLVMKKPTVVRVFPNTDSIPLDVVITGVLITLIKKMGMDAEVEKVTEIDSNILIELSSEDSKLLIGKQGRTLDALQFILNLMVDSKQRKGKRIMIDVAEYRSRRQKRLNKLARAVADRVIKTRKPVLLEYMNPYDRRIIHLALEEDNRVFTKSDGNGVYKRVRVIPQSRAEEYNSDNDEEYDDPEN